MSDQIPLKAEERELESRLRRLQPGAHHLQRDELMFQAGQRAARRQLHFWRAAASVLLLGMILVGASHRDRRAGAEFPAVARVEPPGAAARRSSSEIAQRSAVEPAYGAPSAYLRLRHRLVMEGGDALPALRSYPAAPYAIETLADWDRATARENRSGRVFSPNLQLHGDRS